jgi:LysR family transcriptional regulator, glycine cleavage system transcriptional activator
MFFEQFITTAQAAEAGLGVALLPTLLVHGELREGTLIPALDRPHRSARAYYLVHPRNKANHPPLAAFRRWLLDAVGKGR